MNKQRKYVFMLIAALCILVCGSMQADAADVRKINPGQRIILPVPQGFYSVKWNSSSPKIATVNKNGKVTGKKAGTTVITASFKGKVKKYTIKVKPVALSPKEITLMIGEKKKLKWKDCFGEVTWKSSSKIISISKTGIVKAKENGTAVVTMLVFGKKYQCNVTVKERTNKAENTYAIRVTAGNKTYAAKLYRNAATDKLVKRFPMTIRMEELNGNEKYHYLSYDLPSDAKKPSEIHAGDLMLYGSDCIVLFYKDFKTTYSYTKLGYMEDATGLSEILGKGNVMITLKLN